MINRILLAGVLGGVALFLWEFVAHDLTPLGLAGLSTVPNEDAVGVAMKQALPASGLFYFPAPADAPGMTADQKKDAMNKAMEKARIGPTALIAFRRDGGEALSAGQLLTQFAADVLAMLLLAGLLAQLPAAGFGARVASITALGILPGLRAHIPMWNWYGFPKSYIAAQIAIDMVGFFVAGLILARLVQRRSKTMAAAS
jgi:hypothetical protein